jgi:thioredoxin-like negative regulator of GroEL
MRAQATATERTATVERLFGARQLMAGGMFAEASNLLSDLVEDAPEFSPAWELLARARIASGDFQGAVGAMDGWSAQGGSDAPSRAQVRALQDAVDRDGTLGYWRWTLERLDARAAEGGRVAPTDRAAALVGTGDANGAIAALEAALEQHDRGLATLERDPVWDELRGDPRFADIVRKSRTLRHSAEGPRPPRVNDRR